MWRRCIYLVMVMSLSACFMPQAIIESDQLAASQLNDQRVQSRTIDSKATHFHYVARNSDSRNLIVFIHGTPGDWRIFSPQMESERLARHASLVAIDRPGWGASQLLIEGEIDSLERQSELLGPALHALRENYATDNLVLVGHSLGASLAPRLAIDHPDLIDAVVALAGDLTDVYPSARWYNQAADWRVFRWLVPEAMRRANDEVLALESSLAVLGEQWHLLRAPLLVIQGDKDSLVDPRHADFAESLVTGAPVAVVRLPQDDHLVHLKKPQAINELLLKAVLRDESQLFAEAPATSTAAD